MFNKHVPIFTVR